MAAFAGVQMTRMLVLAMRWVDRNLTQASADQIYRPSYGDVDPPRTSGTAGFRALTLPNHTPLGWESFPERVGVALWMV